MAKKIALLQSNYIPWKGYFDIINLVDEFVVYDEAQYTKLELLDRTIKLSKRISNFIKYLKNCNFKGSKYN